MNINIKRKKLRLGLIYGMVAGFGFAVFAWGLDAWLLVRANSTFFWIKFIPGLVICSLSGALAGWLTMLFEKHAIAMLVWGVLAGLYSWLVVWLPFTSAPSLIKMLDPALAQWFDFSPVKEQYQFRLVSLLVIGLVAIISGLLEINLIHQAMLSAYSSASVMPMLVCLILFSLAGSATDNIINSNLREPVQIINNLIQFAAENQGVEVPVQTARKMHLSSARHLAGVIQMRRSLTLIKFDSDLGLMDILVNFDGTLAKCTTIFAQPTDCIILTSKP